jgi:DNA-binding Xre family transcriptional regulator
LWGNTLFSFSIIEKGFSADGGEGAMDIVGHLGADLAPACDLRKLVSAWLVASVFLAYAVGDISPGAFQLFSNFVQGVHAFSRRVIFNGSTDTTLCVIDMSNVFLLRQALNLKRREIAMPNTAGKNANGEIVSRGQPKERRVSKGSVIVGVNLQRLLDRSGMSQMDLSRKMGMSQSSINSIVRGKRNVSLEMVERFCVALGAEMFEFHLPVPRS